MDNKINLKGIDKAVILAKLYNNSKVQGMGFLQAQSGDMTTEQARDLLKESTYFDYLHGKIMKVDLSGDSFDPWLYDRDNGKGSAIKACMS